jgi:hypothetical protein
MEWFLLLIENWLLLAHLSATQNLANLYKTQNILTCEIYVYINVYIRTEWNKAAKILKYSIYNVYVQDQDHPRYCISVK